MSQSINIIARTFETNGNEGMNDDLALLAGKAAGVCYMPDDYMENGIQNTEKALSRAKQTAESGHHSVYDHGHISFIIKTNKMIAMILNSLSVYATSEKSARYTKMQPETELENRLYHKWRIWIQELILKKYPDIDDEELNKRLCKKYQISAVLVENRQIKSENTISDLYDSFKKELKSITLPSYKLAQENARYMISVFTPTTMMYTVSFRQTFLIVDYFEKLVVNLKHAKDTFSRKLLPHAEEFLEILKKEIGERKIADNKNQYIRFLEAQNIGRTTIDEDGEKYTVSYPDISLRLKEKASYFGDCYTAIYNGSLAMLAQAQRHRTIRYTMCLQEPGFYGYYVPEIVKDAGLEYEWMEDIQSVSYCIPQGTCVRITEQGIFEDFALKCKERMCGRAQLEIMKSTEKLVKEFASHTENLCYSNQELLKSITTRYSNGKYYKPCARCAFTDFRCTEGCRWKAKDALSRLI